MVCQPVVEEGSSPAHEFDPGHLFGALERLYGDQADLPGTVCVSSTARRPVKSFDLDDPDSALYSAFFSEGKPGGFSFGDQVNPQWAVIKHDSIREVRGLGLMIGMELDCAELAKTVFKQMLERGVVLNRTDETVLRFLPPFILQKQHVDHAIRQLDEALAKNTAGLPPDLALTAEKRTQ